MLRDESDSAWRQWRQRESTLNFLTAINRTILWDVLGFDGHPKQTGVLTITFCCDH